MGVIPETYSVSSSLYPRSANKCRACSMLVIAHGRPPMPSQNFLRILKTALPVGPSRKHVIYLYVPHEMALGRSPAGPGDTAMHDEKWNTILAQEVRMVDYAVALELQKEAPQLDELYLPSEETTLEYVRRDLRRILFEVPRDLPGLPGWQPTDPEFSLRELLGKLCKKGHQDRKS